MRIVGGGLLAFLLLVANVGATPDVDRSPGPPDDAGESASVIFAGSANYPPFQWQSDKGPQGFVVMLEDAMAEQGGRRAVHRLGPWEEALDSVASGEADVVALFESDARSARFDFTAPFYYVAHGIFSRKDRPVVPGRVKDLSGHRVGVVAGGYAERRLAEAYPGVTMLPCASIASCLQSVSEGEVDAALVAAHTARRFIAERELSVAQSSAPLWPRPYVFGVREGREEMLGWVERQLALLQANGEYHRIYNEWLDELEWQEPGLTDMLRPMLWIVVPLVVIAIAGFFWSWTLRREVASRTRELSGELEWRKELEDELQYRLGHDDLTGLPNREAFLDGLEVQMAADRNWQGTVITIRVINLEQMITAFSYGVGHDLIKAFGGRLRTLGCTLVGHFGAGVFAAVMPVRVSPDTIMRQVTAPLELDSMTIDPQIALGLVEGGFDRQESETGRARLKGEADELLRRSRTALAAAQAAGRRWQTYSEELEPDPGNLLLLRDFHRAGTRDMFLVFQPKLNLFTGRVDGSEALIRWNHPELGLVSPVRFIPLIEQSGLISQITRWVIEEACRVSARCRGQGFDGVISVNIAAQDLVEMELLDYIGGVLGHGGRLANLRLEITETGFIDDPVRAREVLTDLRSAGIFCAVDDFGTGYSSLSYLSEFPVDEVKIDRVFVTDMIRNERHRLIVRSTIALAHELGLRVTAEGAEDMATIRALAELGCDAVQGFVLSRPVSESELLPMLGQRVELSGESSGPVLG